MGCAVSASRAMLQVTVTHAFKNIMECAVTHALPALFSRRTNNSSILHALRGLCLSLLSTRLEFVFALNENSVTTFF